MSTTCDRNSPECFASKCPIDVRTRMLWMATVIAPPTPQPTYTVLDVSEIRPIVSGIEVECGYMAYIVSHFELVQVLRAGTQGVYSCWLFTNLIKRLTAFHCVPHVFVVLY